MEKSKVRYKTLYLRYIWQSLLFLAVLVLGTFSFYNLEKRYTIYNPTITKDELLQNFSITHNISNDILKQLLQSLEALANLKKPMQLEEAFVYTISVVYTFGWGNVLAYSDQSKIFLIFYACLSIPITTAMVITAGEIINKHLKDIIYKLLKLCCQKQTNSQKLKYYSKLLTAPTVLILFVLYLTTNALMFVHYEGFTYIDSVYFIFTTISTIGFGDITLNNMTFDKNAAKNIGFHLYNHFSITIGMSLLSAIINALLSLPEVFKNKIEKRRSIRLSKRKQVSEENEKNVKDLSQDERQNYTYLNNHFYH